ncbi:MAG: hypothetical protein ACRCY3_14695 [Sphingorhabdus sp.]
MSMAALLTGFRADESYRQSMTFGVPDVYVNVNWGWHDLHTHSQTQNFVIPAKAGIHDLPYSFPNGVPCQHGPQVMDPRLPEGQFILSACLGRQSKGGGDEVCGEEMMLDHRVFT